MGILGFKLKNNSEIIVDDFEFEQSLVVKPSYQSESTWNFNNPPPGIWSYLVPRGSGEFELEMSTLTSL